MDGSARPARVPPGCRVAPIEAVELSQPVPATKRAGRRQIHVVPIQTAYVAAAIADEEPLTSSSSTACALTGWARADFVGVFVGACTVERLTGRADPRVAAAVGAAFVTVRTRRIVPRPQHGAVTADADLTAVGYVMPPHRGNSHADLVVCRHHVSRVNTDLTVESMGLAAEPATRGFRVVSVGDHVVEATPGCHVAASERPGCLNG